MNNSDLSFLTDCSNEQLRLLADVLVFDPKDHKKRYTERLSARASYAVYYPHDMKKLLPEIVDEYQRFGGNTIANIIRDFGMKSIDEVKEKLQSLGLALKASPLGNFDTNNLEGGTFFSPEDE